jgi:hypothetical protein
VAIYRLPQGTDERPEAGKGDFSLWAELDSDTKLVFADRIGRRDWIMGNMFVEDVSNRMSGPVQIATDNLPAYPFHIRTHFGYEGYSARFGTRHYVTKK